jgi:hypothetical protein
MLIEDVNYKIYDNFLSDFYHKDIKEIMIGNSGIFSWYLNPYITDSEITNDIYDFQFTHRFYSDNEICSDFFQQIIHPFLEKLKQLSLIRIKSNLNILTTENKIYGWHTDFPFSNHKTAIYYVNTNNGSTLLKDIDNNIIKIESVANRLVVFDGNIQHTGVSCTDQRVRCVINFNYIEV